MYVRMNIEHFRPGEKYNVKLFSTFNWDSWMPVDIWRQRRRHHQECCCCCQRHPQKMQDRSWADLCGQEDPSVSGGQHWPRLASSLGDSGLYVKLLGSGQQTVCQVLLRHCQELNWHNANAFILLIKVIAPFISLNFKICVIET